MPSGRSGAYSTYAPNGKFSREQVMHQLRRQIDGIEPKKSSCQNAREIGGSSLQRTIYRYMKRLEEAQPIKHAGTGEGHVPAMGNLLAATHSARSRTYMEIAALEDHVEQKGKEGRP